MSSDGWKTILSFWVGRGGGGGGGGGGVGGGGDWITMRFASKKAGLRIRAQLDMEGHIIEAHGTGDGMTGTWRCGRMLLHFWAWGSRA